MVANYLNHDLALALDPAGLAQQLGIDPTPGRPTSFVPRPPAHPALLPTGGQVDVSSAPGAAYGPLSPAGAGPAASPSLRQSQELYRKVRAGYRALGVPHRPWWRRRHCVWS